ncbi:MAG: hypothetical protein U9R08_03715 [Nanoarchaeota archaeon]|nr:hypothetical protein [Nanoarchaeota archaeon]
MVSQGQMQKLRQIKRHLEDPEDQEAARELYLFTDNEATLYNQMKIPIQKNLAKKIKKGTYEKEIAVILWRNLTDTAARYYPDGANRKIHETPPEFSANVRSNAAKMMADDFNDEIEDYGPDQFL